MQEKSDQNGWNRSSPKIRFFFGSASFILRLPIRCSIRRHVLVSNIGRGGRRPSLDLIDLLEDQNSDKKETKQGTRIMHGERRA